MKLPVQLIRAAGIDVHIGLLFHARYQLIDILYGCIVAEYPGFRAVKADPCDWYAVFLASVIFANCFHFCFSVKCW